MPDLIKNNTPVEVYMITDQRAVLVKREDLCTEVGPPFSKVRGIMERLKALKDEGVNTVGYVETSISQAGWGVAWVCKELGMDAIIFDPQYKNPPNTLNKHRRQWKRYKAVVYPIPAGRAKINWYKCVRLLRDAYGDKAVLLPLGLPFWETVQQTAQETVRTIQSSPQIDNVVVNVGSGTIAAGVWCGLEDAGSTARIYGIMGRTGSTRNKMGSIEKKARLMYDGFFKSNTRFTLIDPGWEYTDRSKIKCPFSCNPYYDLKAWQWLMENIDELKGSILFWNIGK